MRCGACHGGGGGATNDRASDAACNTRKRTMWASVGAMFVRWAGPYEPEVCVVCGEGLCSHFPASACDFFLRGPAEGGFFSFEASQPLVCQDKRGGGKNWASSTRTKCARDLPQLTTPPAWWRPRRRLLPLGEAPVLDQRDGLLAQTREVLTHSDSLRRDQYM